MYYLIFKKSGGYRKKFKPENPFPAKIIKEILLKNQQ